MAFELEPREDPYAKLPCRTIGTLLIVRTMQLQSWGYDSFCDSLQAKLDLRKAQEALDGGI